MPAKLSKDNSLQTRWTRTPAPNKQLAAMPGKWLRSMFSGGNQPLRQAARRFVKICTNVKLKNTYWT